MSKQDLSTPLEFTPLTESGPATPGSAIIEVQATEVVPLDKMEQGVMALFGSDARIKKAKETCADALESAGELDISTKKNLDLLVSIRTGVVKERTGAKGDAAAIKMRLGELGKAVVAEAEKVAAITAPVETELSALIDAQRAKNAEAEAEAKRLDDERKARHEENLAQLRAMLPEQERALAAGPDVILAQIEQVKQVEISAEGWEEFAERAQVAKNEVIATLTAWHQLAVANIEAERQRQQAERMAKMGQIQQAVMNAFGKSAAVISDAIQSLEAMPMTVEAWGDMLPQAEAAAAQAQGVLRAMHESAKMAEDAATAAAEKAKADELAAAKAREEAEAAEAERTRQAEAAQRIADEQAASAAAASEAVDVVAVDTAASNEPQQKDGCTGCGDCSGKCHDSEQAAIAAGVVVDVTNTATHFEIEGKGEFAEQGAEAHDHVADPAPVVVAGDVPAVVASVAALEIDGKDATDLVQPPVASSTEEPTIDNTETLSEFCEWLSVCSVTADQLASLGFAHHSIKGMKGNAKRYPLATRAQRAQAIINDLLGKIEKLARA